MTPIRIESSRDPRVADYVDVRESDLVKRRGIFLAEGTEVVRTLLRHRRFPIRSVFLAENRVASMQAALDELDDDVPVYVASRSTMNEVVGFDMHRGCLASGTVVLPDSPLTIVPRQGPATVLVLESIANHDNIGACFRNAAAFGVAAVLLDPQAADPLYRKAIRTSMGAALTVPFARCPDWPGELDRLREMNFEVVALTPSADLPLHEVRLGRRVAFMVGTEGQGLSEAAMARADHRISIPMAAEHDSLNVATAAAIALYSLH